MSVDEGADMLGRQRDLTPMHLGIMNRMFTKTGPRPGDLIDMRLLVLCPNLQDPNFRALRRIMDYIGIRYDVISTDKTDLTVQLLWNGTHARYQGILLTTGYLAVWNSAFTHWNDPLDDHEWDVLHAYQARFGIRLATFCGVPRVSVTTNALLVNEPVDLENNPLELTLTDAGRRLFWYLNDENRIPVHSGAAIGVTPVTIDSTPLLVAMDGLTYGSLWLPDDGCEYLALTMGHDETALHTLLLAYGVINWVSRGIFLGRRNVAFNLQIDDIFTSNRLWVASDAVDAGPVYRLSASDVQAIVCWLDHLQTVRNAGGFVLDFAFNGAAATPVPADQAAVDAFVAHRSRFRWINHGYTHLLLDDVGCEASQEEIQRNHETARLLQLSPYEPECMVTADMSGLTNPSFLAAAAENGIRFLVCDTSRPGWDNPSSNTPIRSAIQKEIVIIPRHPNNLFYDVSTPEAWKARYNVIYHAYWGRDLSCDEIIEEQASQILRYLLLSDIDPLMFHQANLRAYDGTHSLLSDLIDRVIEKYNAIFDNVPLRSLSMRTIGEMMLQRATYDEARINASIVVGSGMILVADRDVEVPVTGASVYGEEEVYGGQTIARVLLRANTVRLIPMTGLVGLEG